MRFIFSNQALRQFEKLPEQVRNIVVTKLEEFKIKPDLFQLNFKKMNTSSRELYRLRVGRYRLLVVFSEDGATVRIAKIGHRRDIYQ